MRRSKLSSDGEELLRALRLAHVFLDTTNCKFWGPESFTDGWDVSEGVPEFEVEQMLMQDPSARWVLIERRTHWEWPGRPDPQIRLITAEQAAQWMLRHGLQVPVVLKDIASKYLVQFGSLPDVGAAQPPTPAPAKTTSVVTTVSVNGERAEKLAKAMEFVKSRQPIKGIAVANHIEVELSTFRRHYVPILKERGMVSGRLGYCVPLDLHDPS